MKKHYTLIFAVLFAATLLFSCRKQTAAVETAQLTDYMPMEVGKFIHYRLDSTLYIDFGQRDTTICYDAKDVVEAAITDNAGRPGYRVVRYLRDTSSTNESDYSPTLTTSTLKGF